jgi:hypothetical protein
MIHFGPFLTFLDPFKPYPATDSNPKTKKQTKTNWIIFAIQTFSSSRQFSKEKPKKKKQNKSNQSVEKLRSKRKQVQKLQKKPAEPSFFFNKFCIFGEHGSFQCHQRIGLGLTLGQLVYQNN